MKSYEKPSGLHISEDLALAKARKEKPSGLHISEDLALATLQKRESLVPKLKEAREADKIAYFVLDRLVIKIRRKKLAFVAKKYMGSLTNSNGENNALGSLQLLHILH